MKLMRESYFKEGHQIQSFRMSRSVPRCIARHSQNFVAARSSNIVNVLTAIVGRRTPLLTCSSSELRLLLSCPSAARRCWAMRSRLSAASAALALACRHCTSTSCPWRPVVHSVALAPACRHCSLASLTSPLKPIACCFVVCKVDSCRGDHLKLSPYSGHGTARIPHYNRRPPCRCRGKRCSLHNGRRTLVDTLLLWRCGHAKPCSRCRRAAFAARVTYCCPDAEACRFCCRDVPVGEAWYRRPADEACRRCPAVSAARLCRRLGHHRLAPIQPILERLRNVALASQWLYCCWQPAGICCL